MIRNKSENPVALLVVGSGRWTYLQLAGVWLQCWFTKRQTQKHFNYSTSILQNSCSKKRLDHGGCLWRFASETSHPRLSQSVGSNRSSRHQHHTFSPTFRYTHTVPQSESRSLVCPGVQTVGDIKQSQRDKSPNTRLQPQERKTWRSEFDEVIPCRVLLCVCVCVRMFLLFCLRRVIKCHAWAAMDLYMSLKICLHCFYHLFFYTPTNVLEQNEQLLLIHLDVNSQI